MEDVDPVRLCRFIWDIWNPFVPRKRLVAVFFNGYPCLTLWTVTLNPLDHRLDYWAFSVSLNGVKAGERNAIVVTQKLRVNISFNRSDTDSKEESNYSFCEENWNTYEFETQVRSPPEMQSPILSIDVEILFPSENTANEEGNRLFFQNYNLILLSADLNELLTSDQFWDLRLRTRNSDDISSAHSCIMRARCKHFLAVHSADIARGDIIDTNISDPNILSAILTYLYSGRTLDEWGDIDLLTDVNRTEICQVIDRYKIHHLYKNLVVDELVQMRRTRRNLQTSILSIRLNNEGGQPLHNPLFLCIFNPGTDNEFILKITFFLGDRVPWFLYTLQWRHGVNQRNPLRLTLYTQFNLELMHITSEAGLGIRTVHSRDYEIRSFECVQSGTCHFEGEHPEFDVFAVGEAQIDFQQLARCTLCFSDGTTVIEVDSEGHAEPPDIIRAIRNRNDLSDDMSELLDEQTEKDLRIVCQAKTFLLHKPIFAFRVPEWKDVIEEEPEGDAVPDVLTCLCEREVFRYVLHYIYTGKIFYVPPHLRHDVERFASRSRIDYINYLWDHMDMAAEN